MDAEMTGVAQIGHVVPSLLRRVHDHNTRGTPRLDASSTRGRSAAGP
jgi:hypothetical protein